MSKAQIQELRNKRANIVTQARAKSDEITAETTEARASEITAEFDAMIVDAEKLETRAQGLERLMGLEASLESGDERRPNGEGEARGAGNGGGQAQAVDYRHAVQQLLAAGGDHYALSPEVRAVIAAGNGTVEARAQIAGTNTAGGFVVPDEMMSSIVQAMAAWGPMFDDGFATVIKTEGGGSIPIPGLDDTAARAEKNANEGAPLTDDGGKDFAFTRKTLEDYLYDTEWLKVSVQLMTGSIVNMESLIGELLGKRLGRSANEVLTVGTGSGEAQGIVTGAGVGFTPASDTSITADDILKLFHSVDPAYRQSPKTGLMFNDTTLLGLHTLKDGQGNYLLSENGEAGRKLRIGAMSSSYTINQAMPDIAAEARPMIFGDMSMYYVRKIGGVVIGTDRGKDFFPGFGMAGFARLDGVVADATAIKAMVMPAA